MTPEFLTLVKPGVTLPQEIISGTDQQLLRQKDERRLSGGQYEMLIGEQLVLAPLLQSHIYIQDACAILKQMGFPSMTASFGDNNAINSIQEGGTAHQHQGAHFRMKQTPCRNNPKPVCNVSLVLASSLSQSNFINKYNDWANIEVSLPAGLSIYF